MIKINLLPFRETLKIEREKRFKNKVKYCVVIGFCLALILQLYFYAKVYQKEQKIFAINQKIADISSAKAMLAKQTQAVLLLEEKSTKIDQLITQKDRISQLMYNLANSVPYNASLITLDLTEEKIEYLAIAKDIDTQILNYAELDKNIGKTHLENTEMIEAENGKIMRYKMTILPNKIEVYE